MTTQPVGSNGLASPWTDERIELLKKLWADGYIAHFIAIQLGGGITKNAVVGKALRLGLEKRKPGSVTQHTPGRPTPYTPRPVRESDTAWHPFLGIALVDLEPAHCRYPKGDSNFLFCGQPKRSGSSYCSHHHTVCCARTVVRGAGFAASWRAA